MPASQLSVRTMASCYNCCTHCRVRSTLRTCFVILYAVRPWLVVFLRLCRSLCVQFRWKWAFLFVSILTTGTVSRLTTSLRLLPICRFRWDTCCHMRLLRHCAVTLSCFGRYDRSCLLTYYTVSQKNKTPNSCPYLRQMLIDFQNSFTTTLTRKCKQSTYAVTVKGSGV